MISNYINYLSIIAFLTAIVQQSHAERFVSVSMDRGFIEEERGIRKYDYTSNFSLLCSFLIFIQTTITIVFNFWSLDFIMLPFVGFQVFFVSLFFVMFGATIFIESLKQLISHLIIISMQRIKNSVLQKLSNILALVALFYVMYLIAPYFRTIVLNKQINFMFYGLIWLPQIIKSSLLGCKNAPSTYYVVFYTIYMLYIPVRINLLNSNIFLLSQCTSHAYLLSGLILIQISIIII